MTSVKKQMKPTSFKPQVLNKSKGIFDDHSVRKSMLTREGTITHTPTNANDIVNKSYVDSQINDTLLSVDEEGNITTKGRILKGSGLTEENAIAPLNINSPIKYLNTDGDIVAMINANGNLLLKGKILRTENFLDTDSTAPLNVVDSSGNIICRIDTDGNLILKGRISKIA